jgi:hypothetical protein
MSVEGMETVRSSLPSILEGFRERPFGHAVHFGRHRRDEAVVMSTAEYNRLIAAERHLDELERLGAVRLVRDRLRDGRFTEGTVDELFAAADPSQ